MRILLATDGNLEKQGICIFMLQWIKTVKAVLGSDGEVAVYFRKSVKDPAVKDRFCALGAEVFTSEIPESGTMGNPAFRKKVKSDLRTLMSDRRFDVVHINSSAKGFTELTLQEAIRAEIPIRISHTHGRNVDSAAKRLYHLLLEALIRRSATIYAGCSADAGQYMFGKKGVKSRRWHFVPNTVDTNEYAFNEQTRICCRARLGIRPEEVLIGAVGYLEEIKNHVFLIDLTARLKELQFPAKLIIFGEGSLKDALEDRAEKLGIESSVILYGATDRISDWLSALDVFVMPSLSEGLPIAAVEAQANGVYCIVSDRVPDEVNLTADICHLPVDAGPEPWVQRIMNLPRINMKEREKGAEDVRHAGFDTESLRDHVKYLYAV